MKRPKEGNIVYQLMQAVGDYVFPSFCIGCKKEGAILCNVCIGRMPHDGAFFDTPEPLQGLYALGTYEEGSLMAKALHQYKYGYIESLSSIWKEHIVRMVPQLPSVDMIVPVPLHKKRYAERGFNQAEDIAHILSKCIDVPVTHVLKRTKATKQQARLDKEQRQKNVQDAFSIHDTQTSIEGKSIMLVDDVYTTGATMGECAQVIQAGGAIVTGFVLGRGI